MGDLVVFANVAEKRRADGFRKSVALLRQGGKPSERLEVERQADPNDLGFIFFSERDHDEMVS